MTRPISFHWLERGGAYGRGLAVTEEMSDQQETPGCVTCDAAQWKQHASAWIKPCPHLINTHFLGDFKGKLICLKEKKKHVILFCLDILLSNDHWLLSPGYDGKGKESMYNVKFSPPNTLSLSPHSRSLRERNWKSEMQKKKIGRAACSKRFRVRSIWCLKSLSNHRQVI